MHNNVNLSIAEQCVIRTHGGKSPDGSLCYFPFVDDDGVSHTDSCAMRPDGITSYCYTDQQGDAWGECDTPSCLDEGIKHHFN